MGDLMSLMQNNPVALSAGLATFFRDDLAPGGEAHGGQEAHGRVRKRLPWYHRLAKQRAGAHAWRQATERWIEREIREGTPAGRDLLERRERVLAALGLTYEQALEKLTFERKGESE